MVDTVPQRASFCNATLEPPLRKIALLLTALVVVGVVTLLVVRSRRARPWNVLLVTFDTTRADHIGCYGNTRIQTPTLDHLAGDGVRFAQALTAVPITAPSHSSILTGRYPLAHGVRDNGLFHLDDANVTLAEILHAHGYATGAAVGAYPLAARFRLNQGFDFYDDHLTSQFEDFNGERVTPKRSLFFDERRAAQVNEALLPWLGDHADKPFFAWVHYFDPHQPFDPAPPYDQLYADTPYDGEIAYADSRLGFLLRRLEELGVLDHTLIVMTADHGEGLDEHGETTHAMLAYNSTLHVPLIIRPPAGVVAPGNVVSDRVANVDIVPTVLELLGIAVPEGVQGRSLVPLMRGEALAPRPQYAENIAQSLSHGWGELRVLFDGPLKYIHGPRPELFDVIADPHELHDLAAQRPTDVQRLRTALQAFMDENAIANATNVDTVDADVLAHLEALGYMQRDRAPLSKIVEQLHDGGIAPQDRVDNLGDISAAKHLLYSGRSAQAMQHIERLIRETPDSPLYLELFVECLSDLGRHQEAWDAMQRLMKVGTVRAPLFLALVNDRYSRGDTSGAIETLRVYLASSPSAASYWVLATFLDEQGRADAAREALLEALKLEPHYAAARVDLGVSYAKSGDAVAARREFEAALVEAPYYAKAHYNYATFSLNEGDARQAAASYRRALAIAPTYLLAEVGLVAAELEAGHIEEARRVAGELQHQAPESEAARQAVGLIEAL